MTGRLRDEAPSASCDTPAPYPLAGGAHHPRLPQGFALPTNRMLVMGILNMTPDSFSDGGLWNDRGRALAHAEEMLEQGVDLIDIGGESTRPNSARIDEAEEWRRIGMTVERLAARGVVVSVDTLHALTARRAADAGAAIINDVSGGRWDEQMNAAVAATQCAYVVQHYRALPGMPGEHFDYGTAPIAQAIRDRVAGQVRDALDAGVDAERVIVDPGLGFSLTNEQCWGIVGSMSTLGDLGYPVLIGASRKRFLADSSREDRDLATLDVSVDAMRAGMWAVRVHAVREHAQLVRRAGSEERE